MSATSAAKQPAWDAATRATRQSLSEPSSAAGRFGSKLSPHTNKANLQKFIADNTAPDTEAIYTDELPAYWGIEDADTRHESVNHSAEEWVRGDVHTNGIESVWSLLERSIVGQLPQGKHEASGRVSGTSLEHRFNNRNNEYLFRDTLAKMVQASALRISSW